MGFEMRLAHEVFRKPVVLEPGTTAQPYTLMAAVEESPTRIVVREAERGDDVFGVHHWPGHVYSPVGRSPANVHVCVGGRCPVEVAEDVKAGDWLAAADGGAAMVSPVTTGVRAVEPGPAGGRVTAAFTNWS